MYLCTKIKRAFSCGWECGGLESLSVTHNLSWTKSAIIELSLHRLNTVSKNCLHYLYDQSRQDFEEDSYDADRVVFSVEGRNLAVLPLPLDMESVHEKSEASLDSPCNYTPRV